jgi:hypothetical protein
VALPTLSLRDKPLPPGRGDTICPYAAFPPLWESCTEASRLPTFRPAAWRDARYDRNSATSSSFRRNAIGYLSGGVFSSSPIERQAQRQLLQAQTAQTAAIGKVLRTSIVAERHRGQVASRPAPAMAAGRQAAPEQAGSARECLSPRETHVGHPFRLTKDQAKEQDPGVDRVLLGEVSSCL